MEKLTRGTEEKKLISFFWSGLTTVQLEVQNLLMNTKKATSYIYFKKI